MPVQAAVVEVVAGATVVEIVVAMLGATVVEIVVVVLGASVVEVVELPYRSLRKSTSHLLMKL